MLRTALSIGLWPATVLASSAFLVLGYRQGLWIPALVALPPLLLAGLYALERILPADGELASHDDPQRGNDIGHTALGGAFGEVVNNAVLLVGAASLAALLPAAFDVWPHAWPVVAQIALVIVGAEFLEYWRHRLAHRVPLLWRAHELHHSGEHLNVLKSSRNHVLDILLRSLTVFVPLVLLGAPPLWIPMYSAAVLVVGPLSHANLALRFPRWLHYVIATPDVHALHHARDPRLSDHNFSVIPLVDIVFGTYEHPAGHGRPAAGVAGPPLPGDFLGQLVAPFRRRPEAAGPVAGSARQQPAGAPRGGLHSSSSNALEKPASC